MYDVYVCNVWRYGKMMLEFIKNIINHLKYATD